MWRLHRVLFKIGCPVFQMILVHLHHMAQMLPLFLALPLVHLLLQFLLPHVVHLRYLVLILTVVNFLP